MLPLWETREAGASRQVRCQLSRDRSFALIMAPELGFAVLDLATGGVVLQQSTPVDWGVFTDPTHVLIRRCRSLESYGLNPAGPLPPFQNRGRAFQRYHAAQEDSRIQSLSARWQKVDFLPVGS